MIDDSLASAGQNFLYLRQVSPKDAKWDARKQQSQAIANLYDLTDCPQYAAQMRFCSTVLAFRQVIAPDGSVELKLYSTRSCRCRFCPSCQSRRSMVWMARSKKALPQVLEEKPKLKFVFLTLTVRNCPAGELRQTIENMNAAWQRLSQRKAWPAEGFIKSIEVTRSAEGEAHPHIHAILAVEPSYFKGGRYLSHEKWVELWKSCLRVDYTPIVNIKVVKPSKNKPVTDYAEAVISSVAECIKYSVKPSDFNMSPPPSQLSNSEWLQALTEQLHGTRAISVGGIIRKYMSEEEPEDLVHTGNAEEEESDNIPVDEQVPFGWREELNRYALLTGQKTLYIDLTTEKEKSPYNFTFIKIPPKDPG